MRIGSLFSGIGGLELGLELAGVGKTIWQVEKEPFCRAILEKHWPTVERFDDVRNVGVHNLESVDLICGGFPCQDLSFAGKGAGLDGEKSGLWFEYERIVREIRPRFVVVENVAALRTREKGKWFEIVVNSLAAFGYDLQWRSIRASDVGAPHKRERIFIVAYTDSRRREGKSSGRVLDGASSFGSNVDRRGGEGVLANSEKQRQQRDAKHNVGTSGSTWESRRPYVDGFTCDDGRQIEGVVESGLGRSAHGIPSGMDRWPARWGDLQYEWEPPRAIKKVRKRKERLQALGNAVVPQVAKEIGHLVIEIDRSFVPTC